jgi:Mg2+-importing ATPase
VDTTRDEPFWSADPDAVLRGLGASRSGLTAEEAARRLAASAGERLAPRRTAGPLPLFLGQFKSPIVLILLAAAVLSGFLGDRVDAFIILGIVAASGLLSFWQEYRANDAVTRLIGIVEVRADVLRDGRPAQVPVDEVVRGDVVRLAAGASVPGDGRVIESRELFVDESSLTG